MTIEEKNRTGFTTGACAAAAAQAAAAFFLTGNLPQTVTLELPCGDRAEFFVADGFSGAGFAQCAIVKDAGSDKDATHGVKIRATIRPAERGVIIRGGDGVGVVTAPGLAVKIGEPAINPVPRQMIADGVSRELLKDGSALGAEITISAEAGDAISKKTFNPKLGIIGGISILGTTGIVRPMSEDGWKRSLLPQIDQAKASGFSRLVLTFGNLGEKAAVASGFSERQTVQMSNFVGFMLQGCLERQVEEVLILGHLGKMIKIACGSFNTHSRVSPQKLALLQELAKNSGAPKAIIAELNTAKSAEAAIDIIKRGNLDGVLDKVADEAAERANRYLKQRLPVSAAITNLSGKIVGVSAGAGQILASVSECGAKK